MISHKYKLICIMPGKTGSVSLSTALMPHSDVGEIIPQRRDCFNFHDEFGKLAKHISIAKMLKLWSMCSDEHKAKHNIPTYTMVGSIRNPWERVISKYFWLNRNRSTNFNIGHFTAYIGHRTPPTLLEKFTYKGQVMMDLFIRHTSFQSDFDIVCERVGLPKITLPCVNAYTANQTKYTEYYNEETKHMVAELYKDDIDFFGYKFGE